MASEGFLIERRAEGDYAITRGASQRATAVGPTQADAIEQARKINTDAPIRAERARDTGDTDQGDRDKSRKVT